MFIEDWEYSNDDIFYIERQKDIEIFYQKWTEEQEYKNKLPVIINIKIESKPDEINNLSRTI